MHFGNILYWFHFYRHRFHLQIPYLVLSSSYFKSLLSLKLDSIVVSPSNFSTILSFLGDLLLLLMYLSSSTMIMLISLSLVAIFILVIAKFLFLCRAVLYVFFQFIFLKFLSDQWARKNYSFINLKGKVIKLVSKIPRKNIHFQWFWWQKQNVKQGVKTEFGLGKTILTPQRHTSCWSCRYRVYMN